MNQKQRNQEDLGNQVIEVNLRMLVAAKGKDCLRKYEHKNF